MLNIHLTEKQPTDRVASLEYGKFLEVSDLATFIPKALKVARLNGLNKGRLVLHFGGSPKELMAQLRRVTPEQWEVAKAFALGNNKIM